MDDKGGWWLVAGGGLIALGSFLPWITVSTAFGTISRSGLDGGDGAVTLVCGTAIGVIGGYIVSGRSLTRGTRIVLWIALVVAAVVWGLDFVDIRDRVASVDSEFALGGVGSGMWVMAVGGVVALVGLFSLPMGPPAPPPSATTDELEQLERIGELWATGELTDEEFQTAKAKLLNSERTHPEAACELGPDGCGGAVFLGRNGMNLCRTHQ